MTKLKWARRIRESCEQAGTYREYFDDVIDTLADILARRDKAQAWFTFFYKMIKYIMYNCLNSERTQS